MSKSAVILAGGTSSRMKYNKEYLKIKSSYLVHNQIQFLTKHFDDIIVVSNNPKHYKEYSVRVVPDILQGHSPIIGLHAGLVHATNDYVYVVACDMPFFSESYLEYVYGLLDEHDAYIGSMNRFFEPFHGIYHKRLIPFIENLVSKGQYGFQSMIRQTNYHAIKESDLAPFINEVDLFKNINTEQELFDIEQGQTKEYRMIDVQKHKNGELFSIKDKVITEYPLTIYVNGSFYMTMMTTPTNLEFLVIGMLFNENLISSVDDIKSLSIQLKDHKAEVYVKSDIPQATMNKVRILSSACGGSGIDPSLDISAYQQQDNFVYNVNQVMETMATFNKASSLFKETGGVHSVFYQGEDKQILIEDIGRHNAVDKVVGYILKNNLQGTKHYLCTSGRISSDILLKCAKSHIPLIVSRSAPTSLAIHLANELHITVIGFARGNSHNVYSSPSRMKEDVQ